MLSFISFPIISAAISIHTAPVTKMYFISKIYAKYCSSKMFSSNQLKLKIATCHWMNDGLIQTYTAQSIESKL